MTALRVLVTGGAGFIGSHVAELLSAAGHEVLLLDSFHPAAHRAMPRSSGGVWGVVPPRVGSSYLDGVELVEGDVRDAGALRRALSGVDAVVHQAAMVGLGVDLSDAPDYVSCNELGTAVLVAELARSGIGRLVLASSMVVYGEGAYSCAEHGPVRPGPRAAADLDGSRFEPHCPSCGAALRAGLVTEDAPADPRNVYAASKLAQEHLCASWARVTGGSAIALRYHNVYGPRMPRDTPYAGVAAIFRSALERGDPPRVFEDGRQRRDFVHVSDVARANLAALAATAGRPGFAAYNIASGEPHTIGEMATALSTAFGGPAPVVTGEYRLGDVRHVVASPGRARRELGFSATVPFAAGMKEFATAPLRA